LAQFGSTAQAVAGVLVLMWEKNRLIGLKHIKIKSDSYSWLSDLTWGGLLAIMSQH